MFVEENRVGGKLLHEESSLPGSYFLHANDLQDGTKESIVFRDGIKTGWSNIGRWKMEFVLRPYSLRWELPETRKENQLYSCVFHDSHRKYDLFSFQTFRSPWAMTTTPVLVVVVHVFVVVVLFLFLFFFPGRAHRTLEQPPNYNSVNVPIMHHRCNQKDKSRKP